jgi:hypothetical protein
MRPTYFPPSVLASNLADTLGATKTSRRGAPTAPKRLHDPMQVWIVG